MAKGPMYVKDFDFSSAGKTVGLCHGGSYKTKMASGGYYADGGQMRSESTEEAKATRRAQDDAFAPAKQLNKSLKNLNRVRKETGYGLDEDAQGLAKGGKWIQKAIKKPGALRATLHVKEGKNIPKGKLEAAAKKPGITGQRARLAMTLGKMHKAAGGPITEAGTGETYPSRAAMVKHESLETPRMQKQEMIQKSTIKAPLKMRAGRAAAGKAAIPPQMPMKKGGFVEGGGMIPNKGSLGVKGNKNPGEKCGKAPIKSHPKYNFAEGGQVKKYAVGGPTQGGALNSLRQRMMPQRPQFGKPQVMQQQSSPMPPRMAPPTQMAPRMPARPAGNGYSPQGGMPLQQTGSAFVPNQQQTQGQFNNYANSLGLFGANPAQNTMQQTPFNMGAMGGMPTPQVLPEQTPSQQGGIGYPIGQTPFNMGAMGGMPTPQVLPEQTPSQQGGIGYPIGQAPQTSPQQNPSSGAGMSVAPSLQSQAQGGMSTSMAQNQQTTQAAYPPGYGNPTQIGSQLRLPMKNGGYVMGRKK